MRRIIYDGDSFYELDEECVRRHRQEKTVGQTPERTGRLQGKAPDGGRKRRTDERGYSGGQIRKPADGKEFFENRF